MTVPAVRFIGITKDFPGVRALSDVSFDVAAGSCHAVCGENGAGKSTLGKILAGICIADAGEVHLDGNAVRVRSPRDALRGGVAMVHQELAFCDNLTVAENLCLGELPSRNGFLNRRELHRKATALLSTVGSTIDPSRRMSDLGVAEQQVVQIAAAVGVSARVIVFDEPTSSLGAAEVAQLHALIGALKRRGVAIIYVSHRLPEIFKLADHVTVLRDGKHVGTHLIGDLDEARLVQLMIGRHLELARVETPLFAVGELRLSVEGLTHAGKFNDVSFTLRAGEIVGLAGLVGAGRTEIGQALFGLDPLATGTIKVRGEVVRFRSPRDAMAHGLAYVPEDRKRQGLVLSMTTRENTTLATLKRYARRGWIDVARERAVVNVLFGKLRVRAARQTVVAALSGGNQQKIVMAKWCAADSDILILDEPTRGIDVGAKAELHAWITKLASEGAAVLLISSELPELLHLSSRLLVLRAGRLVGEVAGPDANQDLLLRMMAGVGPQATN